MYKEDRRTNKKEKVKNDANVVSSFNFDLLRFAC